MDWGSYFDESGTFHEEGNQGYQREAGQKRSGGFDVGNTAAKRVKQEESWDNWEDGSKPSGFEGERGYKDSQYEKGRGYGEGVGGYNEGGDDYGQGGEDYGAESANQYEMASEMTLWDQIASSKSGMRQGGDQGNFGHGRGRGRGGGQKFGKDWNTGGERSFSHWNRGRGGQGGQRGGGQRGGQRGGGQRGGQKGGGQRGGGQGRGGFGRGGGMELKYWFNQISLRLV